MSALSINAMSMEILLQRSPPGGVAGQRGGANVREITVADFRAARLACHFKRQPVGLIIPITGVGLIPELQPLLISCFILL